MDRLDDDALVVDVDDLREREASRMVFLLLGGQTLLDLLPVCLGGSHGVVAVTDCVGEERLRVRAAVLRVEGLAVAQRLQTALDRVGVLALHEVGIIQLGEGAGLFEQRLDDPAVGVVNEDHDVRQLEAGALAHLQTGRDALNDRLFSRADKRCRAGGVLVGLQVDREHDAAARRRAAGPAFGQYRAGRQGAQRAVLHVLLHGLVDALDMGEVYWSQAMTAHLDRSVPSRGIMISGIRVQRFAIGIVLLTGITYVFSIAENPRYGTENIEECNIFLRMLRYT